MKIEKICEQEKVRILALSWRDIRSPGAGGAEVYTHELLKRLSPDLYSVVHISPLYKNLSEKEQIDGITYIRHGNIFSVIWFAMKYYKEHQSDIDYVIDQCNTHRFFTSFWIEKPKRIFLIYQLTREIWDINLKFPFNKIGKALENPLLRFNKEDPTITISKSTKRDLVDVGFPSENIRILPIIVKNRPWKQEEFLEKARPPIFVYVGRYAKYKGIDAAIEAFGHLKADGSAAKLVILGKKNEEYIRGCLLAICGKFRLRTYEPDHFDCKMDTSEYRNADVIFAGFVSEEDKQKVLSQSKALVFPSNREGWGIPISEAAYVGTPSIVYPSEGIMDAIDFGQAGFLCKEKTAESLCEQMKLVLENDDLYAEMRNNAYQFTKEYLGRDVQEELHMMFSENMKKPFFSVVIAAYNSEKTLGNTLRSIQDQTIASEELEMLVVDGGSADATREIAEQYGAVILDNPRRLPEYAKTIGVSRAAGRYVVRMDSGEECSDPTQLQDKMEFLKRHPEIKMLIPNKCSGGGYCGIEEHLTGERK